MNPETLTPQGAMMGEARRPRTLLTAGGAAGRRTNSEFVCQLTFLSDEFTRYLKRLAAVRSASEFLINFTIYFIDQFIAAACG